MHKIVIVDDEPIFRMDLMETLQEEGYEVVGQGSDGFDAIELCRRYKPDVLLIDIMMSVFDGISVSETIMKEELANCIIFITAYANKEFVEKAKQIGVSGYLVKPIDYQTLISTIEISIAQSNRYKNIINESKEIKKKIAEKSLIDRAKIIISNRDNISEGEAYKLIQKISMDKQCSMAKIAQMIVENSSEREIIEKAKYRIIEHNKISEKKAYNLIKSFSKENKCSLVSAAEKINLMNDSMLELLIERY